MLYQRLKPSTIQVGVFNIIHNTTHANAGGIATPKTPCNAAKLDTRPVFSTRLACRQQWTADNVRMDERTSGRTGERKERTVGRTGANIIWTSTVFIENNIPFRGWQQHKLRFHSFQM